MTLIILCALACAALLLLPVAFVAACMLLDAAIRIGPYLVVIWLFFRCCV